MDWESAVESLRFSKSDQQLVRWCYYDDPIFDAADRFWRSDEWEAVKELLILGGKEGSKVLDIGAGRGIASYAFAKEGCEVTALEPDPSAIVGSGAIKSLAQETGLAIRVIEEWGEALPFEDGEFDLIYGRAVFHHAADLNQFASEAARVLRPGGLLLLSREHVISKKSDLGRFLDSHPLHHLYGGEAAYLKAEYLEALSLAGLEVTSTLGPNSSVINYFPETKVQHTARMKLFIRDYFRLHVRLLLPFLLGKSKSIFLASQLLDAKEDAPGRLYSFLSMKPE